jgi:hypothetical protein
MTLLELVDAVSTNKEWRGVHGIAYRDGNESSNDNCTRTSR